LSTVVTPPLNTADKTLSVRSAYNGRCDLCSLNSVVS